MYHLQVVTLSFTMHKWHIYECTIARLPLPKQGGLGWVSPPSGGGGEGLPFNPSPQPLVIKRVTPHGEVFFICCDFLIIVLTLNHFFLSSK